MARRSVAGGQNIQMERVYRGFLFRSRVANPVMGTTYAPVGRSGFQAGFRADLTGTQKLAPSVACKHLKAASAGCERRGLRRGIQTAASGGGTLASAQRAAVNFNRHAGPADIAQRSSGDAGDRND